MIFRIHERPDPKRVMEFEEVAAHFGYSLALGAKELGAREDVSATQPSPWTMRT